MATQSFNKWVKATVVALALAVPSLSQAAYYNSCDPCNPCDPCQSFCDMDFTFGADFIYWKPCVDDLEYTTLDTFTSAGTPAVNTGVGRYSSVCPRWEPGFRLYLGVPGLCYDFDLTASYTWLYSGTTASTTAVAGTSELGAFRLNPYLTAYGSATAYLGANAHYRLHYNEWDVLFSYRIACNPCHSFIPHFGIAGIVTDSRFSGAYYNDTTFVSNASTAFWNSEADYWGVGLRVGSDYEYKFSRCLKAFARAQGTILAGEAKNTDRCTGPGTQTGQVVSLTLIDDHKCCHLVPGYHLAVGVQYDDKMCDMDVFFRIGYEFLNWWNMPNQRTFLMSAADGATHGLGASTSASTRTLGFQGLFVGGGVGF